jgi:predicted ATPase
MNLQSVCFTLQRFMRVVSSASHPVMLFLDDLQWCDNSALALVEGILCDVVGSSYLFFVGSYRSNEVQANHPLLPFMDHLIASGVPTTRLSLEGLNPADLNSLVSDALCMFPRICEPLSAIVFQKTKGNPFFVVEFLRSLVDRGLLEYSVDKRSWVWDEDSIISTMDITGNVLHLLSSKMSGLSENMQDALKVAACFGIKINGSVVSYFSTHPEYSTIRDGLEEAVREGFMMKLGSSDFKFVHDKVREAAYSLIPDGKENLVSFGSRVIARHFLGN